MSIYREYDIRGIYGKDLDEEIMKSIGKAIAVFVRKNDWVDTVVVGNDIRTSSLSLSGVLIKGLTSSGINVIDVGTSSFGTCLFSGFKLKSAITLYITASHLPPEWNGLKIYTGEGIPIPPAIIKKIMDDKEPAKAEYEGSVEIADLKKEYVDFLKSKFKINKKLKIVLDCGNGSTSLAAPDIFEGLGFEVTKLFCDVDPSFPNRPSDPTPNNIKKLVETIKDGDYDFGVAFDGDGDRAAVVDGKGRILTGNELGTLIGKNVLHSEKGNVVITVACSMSLERELKKLGGEVIKVPVGHTFVISKCKDADSLLGVEESGHMVLPEYFAFDDAVLIPLKIADIISKSGKSLSEHYDSLTIYPFEEIVFACPDDEKFTVVKNLLAEFREIYDKITDMDGVRLDFEDGWILIRASNTSPKIRLYVEATTQERLEELKKTFSETLKDEIMKVSP
ncbi:MAG: phosphomannomutase/phosphoglucomutase [Candidatus Aenigmarchaeota archaeon]|nr:phosphomannomutase/phosphoglucomutase [Candidatus Aenigmarchaeota archaeon]